MTASAQDHTPGLRALPAIALLVPLLAFGMLVAMVRGPQLTRPWHAVPATSRAPVVAAGSLVYTPTVDAHVLHPGDVVLYRRPEEPGVLLLHRVEAIRPPGPIGTGVVAVMRSSDPSETPYYVQFAGDVQRVAFAMPVAGQLVDAWQRYRSELFVAAAALVLNGLWLARAVHRRRSHWRVQAVT